MLAQPGERAGLVAAGSRPRGDAGRMAPSGPGRSRPGTAVSWPVEVMLARAVETLPRPDALPGGCLYEPKWDGYRAVIHRTADGVRIQSRRGADITRGFPEITAAAVVQLPPGTVLDGEVVVWDRDRLDFTALQTRVLSPTRAADQALQRPASFLAFDLLAAAGEIVMDQPLRERRRHLEALTSLKPPIQVTPATPDHATAADWLHQYGQARVGVEGLVIKGLADSYRPGQRGWLKLRYRQTAEAIVGAITGTLHLPDRLVLGLYAPDGGLIVAGGTAPLRPRQARDVAELLRPA